MMYENTGMRYRMGLTLDASTNCRERDWANELTTPPDAASPTNSVSLYLMCQTWIEPGETMSTITL